MSDNLVVRPTSWRTMPWKNGGGVTHEIWKDGEPFTVRLSMAEVAEDGPFSRFPGIDRVIHLVEGAGFRLTRSDGATVTLTEPGVPFAFSGDEAWHCTLVDGPVKDFNVMTARDQWVAEVSLEALVAEVPLQPDDFVFALGEGLVLEGSRLAVHDLAVIRKRTLLHAERRTPAVVIRLRSGPSFGG